ncbi:hypothetical protein HDU76_000595 [Blyttiomyces sp. JEL0837]|nr:hypothetical protein HDU76_000595 [Blyttiomyces sp. JEL0837]
MNTVVSNNSNRVQDMKDTGNTHQSPEYNNNNNNDHHQPQDRTQTPAQNETITSENPQISNEQHESRPAMASTPGNQTVEESKSVANTTGVKKLTIIEPYDFMNRHFPIKTQRKEKDNGRKILSNIQKQNQDPHSLRVVNDHKFLLKGWRVSKWSSFRLNSRPHRREDGEESEEEFDSTALKDPKVDVSVGVDVREAAKVSSVSNEGGLSEQKENAALKTPSLPSSREDMIAWKGKPTAGSTFADFEKIDVGKINETWVASTSDRVKSSQVTLVGNLSRQSTSLEKIDSVHDHLASVRPSDKADIGSLKWVEELPRSQQDNLTHNLVSATSPHVPEEAQTAMSLLSSSGEKEGSSSISSALATRFGTEVVPVPSVPTAVTQSNLVSQDERENEKGRDDLMDLDYGDILMRRRDFVDFVLEEASFSAETEVDREALTLRCSGLRYGPMLLNRQGYLSCVLEQQSLLANCEVDKEALLLVAEVINTDSKSDSIQQTGTAYNMVGSNSLVQLLSPVASVELQPVFAPQDSFQTPADHQSSTVAAQESDAESISPTMTPDELEPPTLGQDVYAIQSAAADGQTAVEDNAESAVAFVSNPVERVEDAVQNLSESLERCRLRRNAPLVGKEVESDNAYGDKELSESTTKPTASQVPQPEDGPVQLAKQPPSPTRASCSHSTFSSTFDFSTLFTSTDSDVPDDTQSVEQQFINVNARFTRPTRSSAANNASSPLNVTSNIERDATSEGNEDDEVDTGGGELKENIGIWRNLTDEYDPGYDLDTEQTEPVFPVTTYIRREDSQVLEPLTWVSIFNIADAQQRPLLFQQIQQLLEAELAERSVKITVDEAMRAGFRISAVLNSHQQAVGPFYMQF